MLSLLGVVLASILLLSACHGTAVVEGVVVSPGDGKKATLPPLDGAAISMRCPDLSDGPGLHASTNGQGVFKIVIERRFARTCTLEVQKPGFDGARVALGDFCPRHEEDPSADYCGVETTVVVQLHAIQP